MKGKTLLLVMLLGLTLLLITSCNESVNTEPVSTPDPSLMSITERTIWDFENFRNELNDLAAVAGDTPVEDLESITRQMADLKQEIEGYDFPLVAVKAHSALYRFSNSTFLCYKDKYWEYYYETIGVESKGDDIAHCDQAQIFGESVDLLLQELKEMDAEK